MAQIFSSERAGAPQKSAAGRSAAQPSPHESNLANLQEQADQGTATGTLAQLRALEQGRPLQRMEEEELMQGKLQDGKGPALQRMEEEEALQGKSMDSGGMAIQRMEEEDALQGKPINPNGMPRQLQQGVEAMSGHDLSDVQVHRNSPKPAQVQAHAYAQGSDIHLASGQEQHLPHEAWHVVQQRQGRVKPTLQLRGVSVNDDPGLEKEADVMGAKAAQMKTNGPSGRRG